MKLPSCDADWYVLFGKSGNEQLAAFELRMGGFETYLPMRRVRSFIRKQRLKRETHAPLMPGYIFLASQRGACIDWGRFRQDIRFCHVGRPLRSPDGIPLRIHASEVIQISVDETNGLVDDTGATKKANHEKLAQRYGSGKTFRANEGAFIGFQAVVECVTAHDRIKTLVEIFGRMVPVEFEHWQLDEVA